MRNLIRRIDWTPPTGTVDNLPNGTPYPEGMEAWTVADHEPDASYLDQTNPDGSWLFPERREQYFAGRFVFVGIVVRAPCPCCGQYRYSAGLWGVESDSDVTFFREVAAEEAVTLALDMER